MATRTPLAFRLGSTWTIVLQTADNLGAPLNLTGAAVKWRLVDSKGNVVLDLTTPGTGISVPTPANGIAIITVTPAAQVAAAITSTKTYRDEARVIPSDASVSDQFVGLFTVLPSLFQPSP